MKAKFILLHFLILIACQMRAQVTIGSDNSPLTGALLQLKENDGATSNATKGLGLPRVKLTDINNLYPMFAPGASNYLGANKATEDERHAGLLVYNTNDELTTCSTRSTNGLYVWNGVKWEILNRQMGTLTESAANSNRSDWQTAWGTNPVLHNAKQGVYEEFISADFGIAGRWMTTNLSAKAYDGIAHSAGRTLTGPIGNPSPYPANTAYWCYPKTPWTGITTNEDAPASYLANKDIGLLYSWDAATAGKGGSSGLQNQTNQIGIDIPKVQGICPAGWHLPSDKEWTNLENAIINKTAKYSSLADIDPTNASSIPYRIGATDWIWRGTAQGKAMINKCEPTVGFGASNAPYKGGFSATLAGWTHGNVVYGLGEKGYYWTSSFKGDNNIWLRVFHANAPDVYQFIGLPGDYFSVRCKKD